MRPLWIYADAAGKSQVKPLPLPFFRVTEPVDPELFRRQARGEDMRRPRLPASTGLRAMRIAGEQTEPWRTADGRNLVFIVSGRVELTVGNGSTWMLGAGDIYFEEDVSGRGHQVRWVGDCKVIQLGVVASWSPAGEAVLAIGDDSHKAPDKTPLLRRMYKAADQKSYFRTFENLFEGEPGKWSKVRAVAGFRFVHFPPDSFIDWHPEVVNNFVVVMTGKLELEVSGNGEIEVFGPGDVCLAEDRTGQGHIDRMHGETRLALIVFEDEHLWEPQP